MRKRPTRKALSISLTGLLLILVGTTAQAGWLFVLAAGVLGLVVGSLFVRHRLGGAEIAREAPTRTRVGDHVSVSLRMTNRSHRVLPFLRIEDRHPAFEIATAVADRLPPGATARLESARRAVRRGVFRSGPVEVISGAPFGFVRSRRSHDVPTAVVVVPRWVELNSFPLLEPASFPSEMLHERARTGAGQDYLGVREYRSGDPLRHVHWRSTARAGHLIVREYEEQVQSRVSMVLSGSDDGESPDSSFESLVSAAASIARYALVTGHPVDLVRAGPQGEIERLGDADRISCLDWLAEAQPGRAPMEQLVSAALQRVSRRGTVVLLAPTARGSGQQLQAGARLAQGAGARAIVVAARSSSWDERAPEDRDALRTLGERAVLKVLLKGADLKECLQR